MKIRAFLFSQALLCVAVLPFVGDAAAQNNYPGFPCTALAGAVQPNSNGHAQNSSSTVTATVMCPVIVDSGTICESTSGTPEVWVTDQNTSSDVCCSSRVKNTGQSVISGGTTCSSGANSGAQTLVLTNPATSGGCFTFTHRWIQCDIPPAPSGAVSEVRTYRY